MNLVSTPKHKQEISPEAFVRFLARLSPDPERTGEGYEELRQMMVKFFECRRVAWAEDLTDEVFNRVIGRVADGEMIENLPGYCFSIARFVLLEHSRAPEQRHVAFNELPPLAAPEREDDEEDVRLACLRSCLQSCTAENRA